MKKLQGLYAITDADLMPESRFTSMIEQALIGGAQIIQYRDKSDDHNKRMQQAMVITQLCKKYEAVSIINDDLQLTMAVDADGVHIGQSDENLVTARQQLGPEKIIGVSCYNQLALAVDAEKAGADYIAFGSFFPSPTKPGAQQASIDLLGQARSRINIPICAIGGITQHNAGLLIDAGADMLAVISSIFDKKDVLDASNLFQDLFNNNSA